MTPQAVMILARKHLGNGSDMESSARLCFADAVKLYDAGNLINAKRRALKSIAYSVGILHPDHIKASAADVYDLGSRDYKIMLDLTVEAASAPVCDQYDKANGLYRCIARRHLTF